MAEGDCRGNAGNGQPDTRGEVSVIFKGETQGRRDAEGGGEQPR